MLLAIEQSTYQVSVADALVGRHDDGAVVHLEVGLRIDREVCDRRHPRLPLHLVCVEDEVVDEAPRGEQPRLGARLLHLGAKELVKHEARLAAAARAGGPDDSH
eukprot:scaffold24462_cov48-Phaeocystis_antarctica.AAC.2